MFSRTFRTFRSLAALSLLWFVPVFGQNAPTDPATKILPDRLGEFRAAGTIDLQKNPWLEGPVERFGLTSAALRPYVSRAGQRFSVALFTMASDSAAYAELTQTRRRVESSNNSGETRSIDVGTAGFTLSRGASVTLLAFFKGRAFVEVRVENKSPELRPLMDFARSLSDTLDKGAGEIPVLIKHLPDWQNVQAQVLYAVNTEALKNAFSNQPVLDVVSFEGGAEAAVADYGPQKLVVVEFNTASLATDNDQRIKARLQELSSQGQPAPTAYRRVGNYAVFVFDAPSPEAANQLIDQVKYQQVVQWLGQNPFSYEQAVREFTETTLGVFVSVVKTSGLALVGCLAVGGFFGALLFRFRRARQQAKDAYSDADAMLRLNLDELTPESDPARLLGSGNVR
ncbi:MAG: DUF6599 family protein [Pyrinomonadaceae bacterium]